MSLPCIYSGQASKKENSLMIDILPKDFFVRPPTMDNLLVVHKLIEECDFDPSLWFLALDGNEIAGASLCTNQGDYGWVDTLAVRRPWRRKGLGMALLLHSFAEFYRRSKNKIGLGVDSQNLTGATRLYERAGMHVARIHITYEKELRAGIELSTQAAPV